MITRRRLAEAMLCGLVLAALGGCGEYNPYKFRAKVTIMVDTPSGIRSGSGVYEIWANWSYPGTTRRRWGQSGEAIVVDLPNGRTLFSLLKTGAIHGDIASMVLAALDPKFRNTMVESTERLAQAGTDEPRRVAAKRMEHRPNNGNPFDEEVSNYPMLVTFKDIKDPTSVELVDPDDLAASFGPGYRLRAITAQVTDEPVTVGIGKRLGWLTDKNRKRFYSGNKPKGIPLGNYSGLFSTEISG
jgi:hypothetical protein